MKFRQEYNDFCVRHGAPDRIELLLCDLNAVLRGKWLPGDSVDKLEQGAVRIPLSTCAPAIMGNEVEKTGLGISVGDPDGILVPVEGSLHPAPWLAGNVAQVLVEMSDRNGTISPHSPRKLLRNMLTRFDSHGLRPVVATELEFYIIRARGERTDPPCPPPFSPDAQNYDMETLRQCETILNDILAACNAQGLATDTLIAEYGPGQFEINFHHTDDVMVAADTTVHFRRLVRGVVSAHGLEATFMAKPYPDHPGNGMHVHASLVDFSSENVFTPHDDTPISQNLRNAVAGVLDTMRDLQAIFAPHANSYRRFRPDSFAPATPDWGLDNRAAAVRLPETVGRGARLEHRISGADTNPYLVLTAILGGMLHGLESAPDLKPPLDHAACTPDKPLDHDWYAAVNRFEMSDVARDIFGDFRALYAAVKRDEIAAVLDPITPSEYAYYLSRP